MLFKNIHLKDRLIQIVIETHFSFLPRSGQYPKGSKYYVFKWYAWGYVEVRRFYTQTEQNKWVIEDVF